MLPELKNKILSKKRLSDAANSRAKSIFDLVTASALLLFLAPLLASISLCILISMGRPILFRQLRIGLDGQKFYVLKFRTMVDHAEKGKRPANDDGRMTRFGRMLRLTSLDELPQIFNVLKGEMSLVGPRPQIVSFERYYSQFQFRRHEVRPGITGWAQINGRNSISWDRKFELDVWYVDNWSFLLDLKIIVLTPFRLLSFQQVVGPYRYSELSFDHSDTELKTPSMTGPQALRPAPSRDQKAG